MSREAFEIWAPPDSEWSQWAKPAPFIGEALSQAAIPASGTQIAPIPPDPDLCVVLDLPGPDAIRWGIALARKGFRPVPVINTTSGAFEAIPMGEVLGELRKGAQDLAALAIGSEALPAFILDSRRKAARYSPTAKTYDNRWMVFPQDLPSGNYLAGRGVRRAMLVSPTVNVADDLRHVLRRWQDAGIKILLERLQDGMPPFELTLEKPLMFRQGWYRFLVAMGLKKNAAGGFGGTIPEPSKGGYG